MILAPSMNPEAVAIIGCGWLGTPLATHLIARGDRVVATCSRQERVLDLERRGIQAISLVLNPVLICNDLDLLRGIRTAFVLLPPQTRQGRGDSFPDRISNLIAGLKDVGIGRVIFSSSTTVYPALNRAVDETESAAPDTEAGRILFEAEHRILAEPNVESVIIRFAGLCGPGREPGSFLAGRKNVPGGDDPVNLIHQQDAIDLLCAVLSRQPWGQVFNGCAPGHPSRYEIYHSAAEAMGLAPPVFGHGESRFKVVLADKACKQLGFVYRHPDPLLWRW